MRAFCKIAAALSLTLAAAAQTPTISAGGILNGASFATGQPITPGSLISIFGSSLATAVAQADSIPLTAALGKVSVNFVTSAGTFQGRLLYVQNDDPSKGITSQINLQVPWDVIPAGTTANVNVVVTSNGVSSAPTSVSVGPYSPGVFASGGRA